MNNFVNDIDAPGISTYPALLVSIIDFRSTRTDVLVEVLGKKLPIIQLLTVVRLLKKLCMYIIKAFSIQQFCLLEMTICAVQACTTIIPPGKSLH
jgi:hypothetical protein